MNKLINLLVIFLNHQIC